MRYFASLLGLLFLPSCGQVVAIKIPRQDPNPNAFYLCEPAGDAFQCKSERAFHQYDRELSAGEKECEYGVANVYVETSWHGSVKRVQYQCSVAPVGDFRRTTRDLREDALRARGPEQPGASGRPRGVKEPTTTATSPATTFSTSPGVVEAPKAQP